MYVDVIVLAVLALLNCFVGARALIKCRPRATTRVIIHWGHVIAGRGSGGMVRVGVDGGGGRNKQCASAGVVCVVDRARGCTGEHLQEQHVQFKCWVMCAHTALQGHCPWDDWSTMPGGAVGNLLLSAVE